MLFRPRRRCLPLLRIGEPASNQLSDRLILGFQARIEPVIGNALSLFFGQADQFADGI